MEILTKYPTKFRSGETITWQESDDSNYPQSLGFAKKYTINGLLGFKTITGSFASGLWTFTLTASDNDLEAGSYTMYGFVTRGTGASEETYAAQSNPESITVELAFKNALRYETRSFAQVMVAKLETFLDRIASNPIYEEEIAGRVYTRNNILEVTQLRNQYLAEVKRNENDVRMNNGEEVGDILTTFPSELG
jgi:hypothetical protein